MKNHRALQVLLLIALIATSLFAQNPRRNEALRQSITNPAEMVSFNKATPFSQALDIFNDLSKEYLGKVIVDSEQRNFTIGINIHRTHWFSAMETILRQNGLWYSEYQDYIRIITVDASLQGTEEDEFGTEETFESREVEISAVFFEADASKLRQLGLDWSFFRDQDATITAGVSAAPSSAPLEATYAQSFDWGDISSTFRALESDQVGEVVSSPQVTVRSGEEGRIQVGSDIAVTVDDFAGNAVTQFFSTGSIILVRPEVIRHDTVDFVNLYMEVERSSRTGTGSGSGGGGEGGSGLEIDKSSAKTSVLLLDGEETVIGGLFINEATKVHDGVPFLKDLPPWFFGLRYLFGNETTNIVKKELLILVRARILPTLRQRLVVKRTGRRDPAVLKTERLKQKMKLDYYKNQLEPKR